jgi:hypothetical protein
MTSCVACGKKEEYMELGALKTEGEEHRWDGAEDAWVNSMCKCPGVEGTGPCQRNLRSPLWQQHKGPGRRKRSSKGPEHTGPGHGGGQERNTTWFRF